MAHKLRIAIDCRITSFQQGVGTAVMALAKALSSSDVTNQEYTFVVREGMLDCLSPYVYGPCRLKGIPESKLSAAKAGLRWIAPLRFIWHKYCDQFGYVPVSDGYVESEHFDVVHFPTQVGYLTELPTIYQPWDLQHLHYPQFFSKSDFAQRERLYRALCDRASYICVQADWTRKDIVDQYKTAEEKIVVIPWGSVFDAYKDPSPGEIVATADRYNLPSCFFFYPAVTWPHKNHEVILRALHVLKSEHGIAPHVVFTGLSTDYRQRLDALAKSLDVTAQLHFLGFVTPIELQSIYRSATAMIFPSKFEGFGLPILEAFHAGLAVLSSNATTLPEVARDGALYFDPDSPVEVSALMRIILNKPDLRQDLVKKGTLVLSQYSIRDTSASFQQLYARAAGLSSPDHRVAPASAAIQQEE